MTVNNAQADILRQCDKFRFLSLKEDMDGRLAKSIDAMHPAQQLGPCYAKHEYVLVDCKLEMFRAVKEFELPKTEEAVVSYLIRVIEENHKRLRQSIHDGYNLNDYSVTTAMGRIETVLSEMHEARQYKICSLFTQAAMKKRLLLLQIESKK